MAKRSKFAAAAFGAALIALAANTIGGGTASAQDAAAATETRVKAMKQLGGHMKALGDMAKGTAPYDQPTAVANARGVQDTARRIHGLFPEGSASAESRAKPEIWQRWADFEGLARNFEQEAEKLVQVAEAGDPQALGPQVGAVGKGCGTCHDSFRAPKR